MAAQEMSDAGYLSIASLDTPEKLQKKFDEMKNGRSGLERQWRLNLAFYKGKQWSYIDPGLGRIITYGTEEGEKPRHRVRITSNQISGGVQSLLAKMTKTKPVISATPGSSSDADIKAAQMAESLLEFWWDEFEQEDLLYEALTWAVITGQGYWKITWDQLANKALKFVIDPSTGQPITDDAKAEEVRSQAAEAGQEVPEQTVYLGDIKIEAMSPFDVFLDPTAKTFKDCKYVVCVHHLSVDEIQGRWGKRGVKPDSASSPEDVRLPFTGAADAATPNVKRVYVGYFLPQPALPQGRYVVWMEKPNTILEDSKWPYPTNELPIVKFPGVRVPGSIYDGSEVETSIPLQKELNKTISQIVAFKNLTINPRVWAPVGSIRTKINNEPGAVYQFTPIAGLKPEIEKMPSMQPYVFEHLKDITSRLRDVFYLQDVTEGTVPPNVEAGIAIDLLQEMATDRLAPKIRLMETGLGRAGQLMLNLAQQYYIEPRMLKIRGSGGSVQVRKFTQADIAGGISVNVEAGSGLPRTRAGRQARIQSYVEMGVIKPDQAWKHLDIADLKGVAKMFQADEDMAYREHDKLIRGIPINQEAMQNAIMQADMGINPETGMAFADENEVMSFIEGAAYSPMPFENSTMHLDTHHLFMKSVEYEALSPDAQRRFQMHSMKTQEKLAGEREVEENVKASLALKGTIGPTGAAEILNKLGNPGITPEVMAEPPLETWVTDSMDKPDVDEAGNDPFTPEERAHQELMDAVRMQDAHEGSERRAEEKHQVDLKRGDELHQAKLVKARKPSAS